MPNSASSSGVPSRYQPRPAASASSVICVGENEPRLSPAMSATPKLIASQRVELLLRQPGLAPARDGGVDEVVELGLGEHAVVDDDGMRGRDRRGVGLIPSCPAGWFRSPSLPGLSVAGVSAGVSTGGAVGRSVIGRRSVRRRRRSRRAFAVGQFQVDCRRSRVVLDQLGLIRAVAVLQQDVAGAVAVDVADAGDRPAESSYRGCATAWPDRR